ncbi:PREDICTED: mitochondrial genome maintenance exonuclease 1 isoform X1 [Gavialis gangeticus]|uniref:mitochondrial genome maintenance exonuclease 1 isoform X1 n=2 Tax=Gavialis gangeticus TaxID=94835 RepID=UPI00092FC167|nr:PREDICTED: mitochondrial genome maintenance exonuclease 1 isoform X1 [Gavialis gangeticus]XP_019371694.1 PREDICTED: mitochondrial genome maintenance exonuclease 1 isoform X1 [Gavialis gangeticus]
MQLWGIKSLQLFTKKCGVKKKLLTEHFCKKQVPHALLVTSTSLQSNKKDGYEQVSKKYKDLHRSVTSFKDRPRTPETLFKEDSLIYGPVIKCRSPDKAAEAKTPKNWVPLLNPSKKTLPLTNDPRLPLKVSLGKHSIPSVTNILQQTMPEEQAFYLKRWKQQMILKLGEDGFAEYNKNILLQGTLFHAALEHICQSREVPQQELEDAIVSGYVESVQHVLREMSGVKALESAVQHETLQYLGLVDCVAEYRGQLCVIDWKTSEKPKPFLRNTFDNPLQIAAYVGAINHDANYDFQVNCGLIVVAYKDGSPAHPHFMDMGLCSQYWTKWLLRLEEYGEKRRNDDMS